MHSSCLHFLREMQIMSYNYYIPKRDVVDVSFWLSSKALFFPYKTVEHALQKLISFCINRAKYKIWSKKNDQFLIEQSCNTRLCCVSLYKKWLKKKIIFYIKHALYKKWYSTKIYCSEALQSLYSLWKVSDQILYKAKSSVFFYLKWMHLFNCFLYCTKLFLHFASMTVLSLGYRLMNVICIFTLCIYAFFLIFL